VALTEDQQLRLANALRAKLTEACPLCRTHQWTFDQSLVMLQALPAPSPSLLGSTYLTRTLATAGPLAPRPGPSYPTLPVMCGNCGNTVLLNVYKLGIADLWKGQIPASPQV